MNFRKTLVFLVACIGLSFIHISCGEDEDYYWTDAIIRRDFEMEPHKVEDTASDVIDIHKDVYNKRNTRFYKLKDIEFIDGSIEVTADRDYREVYIQERNHSNKVSLGPGRVGETRFENIEITHFHKQLVENLRKEGYAIYLFGFSSTDTISFLNVRVYMNIRALVKD